MALELPPITLDEIPHEIASGNAAAVPHQSLFLLIYNPKGSQSLITSANVGHSCIFSSSIKGIKSHSREIYFHTKSAKAERTPHVDIIRAESPEHQFVSAGPLPLYLAAPSGPGVLLSLKQTAPVPQPRSQPSSICMTCASLFVLSRLLDAADNIELCRRHSSVHAR